MLESEKLIYESVKEGYDFEIENFNSLNNRGSLLIIIDAAILTLHLQLGINALNQIRDNVLFFALLSVLFIGGLLLLMVSMGYALKSYRFPPTIRIGVVPDLYVLVKKYHNKPIEEVRKRLIGTLVKAQGVNLTSNLEKVKNINKAYDFLMYALIWVVIYAVWFIFILYIVN